MAPKVHRKGFGLGIASSSGLVIGLRGHANALFDSMERVDLGQSYSQWDPERVANPSKTCLNIGRRINTY